MMSSTRRFRKGARHAGLRSGRRALAIVAATGIAFSQIAVAAVAPATQDTYVDGGAGQASKNKGSQTLIRVQTSDQLGLLQFDLSSLGGTVTSATLSLNVLAADIPGNINIHQILGSWNEPVVSYNLLPSFAATPAATVTVGLVNVGGTVSVDITDLAQAWVSEPGSNFGLVILPDNVDARFGTKEGGQAATLTVVGGTDTPPPPPPPPGAERSISSVDIDFTTGVVRITGQNFDNGVTPTVELGEFGTLSATPISSNLLEAVLPSVIADGDYLLTVKTGPDPAQIAKYDTTIGAVGPAGPQGPKGDQGPQGLQGIQGIQGFKGDKGDSGTPGLNGLDGTSCSVTQNTDGATINCTDLTTATVLNGAQGEPGPQGEPGVISDGTNTSAGSGAFQSNTTGSHNTALGQRSLSSNTTGIANTAVGSGSLKDNTTGTFNTAIGNGTLIVSQAHGNTAIGANALFRSTSGSRNTALGQNALTNNTTGSSNIAIGNFAGTNYTTESFNIAIGHPGVIGENNTVRIGNPDNVLLRTFLAGIVRNDLTATGTPVVIDANGQLGVGTGAIGPKGDQGDPGLDGQDGLDGTSCSVTQNLDGATINCTDLSSATVFNGADGAPGAQGEPGPQGEPGVLTDTLANTRGGTGALISVTTGSANTAFAYRALGMNSTGGSNTALGQQALWLNETGSRNTAVGSSALQVSGGNDNTAVGQAALFDNLAGSRNVSVGKGALQNNRGGNENTAVGVNALSRAPFNTVAVSNSTAVGFAALMNNLSPGATAIGHQALHNNTSGGANTAVGSQSLFSNQTGNRNTAVGVYSLNANTNSDNSAFGNGTLRSNTSGSSNTAVGSNALSKNTLGSNNIAVGFNALLVNSTGQKNVAMGVQALSTNDLGSENIAIGADAAQLIKSSFNVAIGNGALKNVEFGGRNIAIGHEAGTNLSSVSDKNIMIGSSGNPSDLGTLRIGTGLVAAYISGIWGMPTLSAGSAVIIDAGGKLGTVNSSRRYKEDIEDMGDASERLLTLRPVTFRYTEPYKDGSKPIQYGLIAEEVAEVFPDLAVFNEDGQPQTVKYHVLSSLLLNELQKQVRINEAQSERLAKHEMEESELQARLVALEAQALELQELKAQLEQLLPVRVAASEAILPVTEAVH